MIFISFTIFMSFFLANQTRCLLCRPRGGSSLKGFDVESLLGPWALGLSPWAYGQDLGFLFAEERIKKETRGLHSPRRATTTSADPARRAGR